MSDNVKVDNELVVKPSTECEDCNDRIETSSENQKMQNATDEERKAAENQGHRNELRSNVVSFLGSLLCNIIAVGLVFTFGMSLFIVEGRSMFPTLHDKQIVLVRRIDRYFAKAGDIVAIQADQYPGDNTIKPLVKRVIATEGQKVFINYDTNTVYVDDTPLNEPYINHEDDDVMEFREGYGVQAFVVPAHHVFVMGDNRNNSTDSRSFDLGSVDRKFILGIVLNRS